MSRNFGDACEGNTLEVAERSRDSLNSHRPFVPCQTAWRRGWDLNPRSSCPDSGFQDRHVRPLRHPSGRLSAKGFAVLGCSDPIDPAHIGSERFRNDHRSIGLLVVLQDRHQGATYGES